MNNKGAKYRDPAVSLFDNALGDNVLAAWYNTVEGDFITRNLARSNIGNNNLTKCW
jgi:hypothetical protein